jgi:hypothetical protein
MDVTISKGNAQKEYRKGGIKQRENVVLRAAVTTAYTILPCGESPARSTRRRKYPRIPRTMQAEMSSAKRNKTERIL